ncbi:MAG TPA: ROK family protein [Terriglobales bacterium]|nr:ROK family protein [Terriglobales bacterium]
MGFAIGVDLGGTNLRIAAVDEEGRLLEKVTTGTQVSRGRDAVITEMTAAIQELAAKFKGSSSFLGAGIGVPGIIDKRTGMLRESPNLPGWDDYPVRDDIEKRLKTPVVLENDANAAALGENWLGAAKGMDDMCMITLGTGVGGGIVQGGRIWHGMTGMAGELGHITIDPDGPRCGCGSYGCVEVYASATAIVRMAREAIEAGKAPELAKLAAGPNVEFSAKAINNLALQGDKPAQQIFDKVGWALGILLADLVNAFNLHMYVIGGGVSAAWSSFSPALFDEIFRRCMVYAATAPDEVRGPRMGASAGLRPLPSGKKTIITRALLGSDAGLYGAARLPMIGAEMDQQRHVPAYKTE